MRITIKSPLVRNRINEKSAFNLTAKFWDDSTDAWSASTPTTIKYRVDSLDSGYPIIDWTSITAASSVTVPSSVAANTIQNDCKSRERRQITVKADDALSTQYQATYSYFIENLVGQT